MHTRPAYAPTPTSHPGAESLVSVPRHAVRPRDLSRQVHLDVCLLLQPMGLAYVISIFASLFIALTVTPVLASFLLPRSTQNASGHQGWLAGWILQKIVPLCGPSCKLRLARFSAELKFQDGPSVAKIQV